MIRQLFMLMLADEMACILPKRHIGYLREHDHGAALRSGKRTRHERCRSERLPLQIGTSAVLCTLQRSEYTQAFMHAVRLDTTIKACNKVAQAGFWCIGDALRDAMPVCPGLTRPATRPVQSTTFSYPLHVCGGVRVDWMLPKQTRAVQILVLLTSGAHGQPAVA